MCSKKICILIKKHQNNHLFSYYKLGRRSLELNLCSHCFNLKDLNLNKHFEPLRKDVLFVLQHADLTKCSKCMLFTLRVQMICNNEQSHVTVCDFLGFVGSFFWNSPRESSDGTRQSKKKTTSCKKATKSPGWTFSLIGQKNIFLANQRHEFQNFWNWFGESKFPGAVLIYLFIYLSRFAPYNTNTLWIIKIT